MIGIGGNALETVEQGLLQRADVVVAVQVFDQLQRLALESTRSATEPVGMKVAAASVKSVLPPAAATLAFMASRSSTALLIRTTNRSGSKSTLVRVEKMASIGEAVGGIIDNALAPALLGKEGEPLQGMDEKILEVGDLLVLAADADDGTADSFGGLFTLIAKHTLPPLLF